MKDMQQTERQIFILLLLAENKKSYTIQELRESLAQWDDPVDQKTIRRDIDSLSQICFISEEVKDGKTYYSADKFKLKDITFSSHELVSIAFILELIKPYEFSSLGRSAATLMNKIIDHTSNVNRAFVKHFSGLVNINTNTYVKDKEVDPQIEHLLNIAVREKKKVQILYRSYDSDKDTRRVISPYEILLNDGCLNVIGYCQLRNSIRDFRISRIKELSLLEEGFEVPEEYMATRNRRKFIHLSGEEDTRVVLRFNQNSSKYIKEYEADKADELIEEEEGLTFIRQTAITDDLIGWILKYCPNVTVLEPESLRNEVKNRLKLALENY